MVSTRIQPSLHLPKWLSIILTIDAMHANWRTNSFQVSHWPSYSTFMLFEYTINWLSWLGVKPAAIMTGRVSWGPRKIYFSVLGSNCSSNCGGDSVRHVWKGSLVRRRGELSSILSWIESIESITKQSLSLRGPWVALKIFNLTFLFPKEMSIAPVLQLMHALATAKNGRPRMWEFGWDCVDSISRTMKLTGK